MFRSWEGRVNGWASWTIIYRKLNLWVCALAYVNVIKQVIIPITAEQIRKRLLNGRKCKVASGVLRMILMPINCFC